MTRYAVIDFETSALSPLMGDRALEIAAVIVENGEVRESWQSLMNPGIAAHWRMRAWQRTCLSR